MEFSVRLLYRRSTANSVCPNKCYDIDIFWCFFPVKRVYLHLCVCVCNSLCFSVWDALTDNYISSWDNPSSEALNGNLSDQEVRRPASDTELWNCDFIFVFCTFFGFYLVFPRMRTCHIFFPWPLFLVLALKW